MSWPTTIDYSGFRLREWCVDDVESLVRHANDAEVSRRLGHRFPYPYTEEDARIFISQALHLPGERCYAIEVNGEASGGIGVHPGDGVESRSAELGYWLGRTYWGEGIASAAVSALVPHALRELQLYRLHARVFADNGASMRVLENCGFVREATLRNLVFKHDTLMDMVIYAITRDAIPFDAIDEGIIDA